MFGYCLCGFGLWILLCVDCESLEFIGSKDCDQFWPVNACGPWIFFTTFNFCVGNCATAVCSPSSPVVYSVMEEATGRRHLGISTRPTPSPLYTSLSSKPTSPDPTPIYLTSNPSEEPLSFCIFICIRSLNSPSCSPYLPTNPWVAYITHTHLHCPL